MSLFRSLQALHPKLNAFLSGNAKIHANMPIIRSYHALLSRHKSVIKQRMRLFICECRLTHWYSQHLFKNNTPPLRLSVIYILNKDEVGNKKGPCIYHNSCHSSTLFPSQGSLGASNSLRRGLTRPLGGAREQICLQRSTLNARTTIIADFI